MGTLGRPRPALTQWSQLGLQVVLALALVTVVQFLATRHNVRFDLTPTKAFLLSRQARDIAEGFDRAVRITAFYNGQDSGQRRQILDVLEQFQDAASSLEFRLVDLDRSPGLARKYGISRYNTGVLETDDQVVPLHNLEEEEIMRVMIELSRDEPRRLCFVTGHGERTPESADERSGYSEVAKDLERERFEIQTLTTISASGIPGDCTVLILAGPSHDFLPGEAEALRDHLKQGGKVLLLVDPDAPAGVVEFLRSVGIEAGHNLIVDEQNRFIGADSFMPQVIRFRTDLFRGTLDAPAVLVLARTVRPAAETDPESPPTGVVSVAATSPESWALTGVRRAPDSEVRFRRGVDQEGPLSVGVLATFENEPPEGDGENFDGKLIVFGDSDFATNFFLNILGNKDLFMSTIALLAADPELVTVRRKGPLPAGFSPISLTAAEARLVFWIAVVALPATCLLAGAVVLIARRKQRGGR